MLGNKLFKEEVSGRFGGLYTYLYNLRHRSGFYPETGTKMNYF